jgi:hypothetical protein
MYYVRFIDRENGKYYQSSIVKFGEEKKALQYYKEAVKEWQEVRDFPEDYPNTLEEDIPGIVLQDGTNLIKYWNITKSKAARYGSHNANILRDEYGRMI